MFKERLEKIYTDSETVDYLDSRLQELVAKYQGQVPELPTTPWDQGDAFLITYGDSIVEQQEKPLQTFARFAEKELAGIITLIHFLPFFPWTSDDGFAVKDFREVNPELGDWDDIKKISEKFRLVFDAVINHVSESSIYMEGYRKGDPKYKDFFIDLDPATDTSSVLRTRNLPLLHDYETREGVKWLWTTFSRDQLDLNFANPEVLLEIIDVLLGYLQRGATMIRLDAIPYLWKELGTSCAHLPQTHEIIKLVRDIFDAVCPGFLLLTETNVPHHENMSYFGNKGDEAQMIYNFSLAPLIAYSLLRGDGTVLSEWASQVEWLCPEATYLNITATHDGIGMRPTEGILSEEERQMMVEVAKRNGGDIAGKRNSDGSISLYEININYFDMLNDPNGDEPIDLQIEKFMLSQTIPMSFIGMPGIYIHSLLGSRNYYEGVKKTGRARSINREQLEFSQLENELTDAKSIRAKVLTEYKRRLRLRSREACFHPDARQEILNLDSRVFALQRTCEDRKLLAIHSLVNEEITISVPVSGTDLLSGEDVAAELTLRPYQTCWIV